MYMRNVDRVYRDTMYDDAHTIVPEAEEDR